MKLLPDDGGQRLLRIAALAAVLGALFLANVSAFAGAAGALLAVVFLVASVTIRRRRAKSQAG